MRRPRTRTVLLAAVAAAVLAAWYTARFDGEPVAIDALVTVPLRDSQQWLDAPVLVRRAADATGVFVVPPATPAADGFFAAVRVDTGSGAQSDTRVTLGPGTGSATFDSAEAAGVAAVELRGVTLPRPTFYLFRFPGDGGGPGFDVVESATGTAQVVARAGDTPRTLLTWTVVNSSRLPEIASRLWVDDAREVLACLWQHRAGWTLYVFSLAPGRSAAADGRQP